MPQFDASERAAIRIECNRLEKAPLPSNLTGFGWLLFLLGGGMFTALPALLADQTVSDECKIAMAVVIITLIVVGIWFAVRGNRRRRFIQAQIDAAIAELHQFPATSLEARRAAAIRLVSYIPNRDWNRRVEALHAEIPEALPYVLAVRDVLDARSGRAKSSRGRLSTGSGRERSQES